MELNGMKVVVTGSTSGIGRSIASLFSQMGAEVAIVGRSYDRGMEIVDDLKQKGFKSSYFQADLTNELSVKEMVSSIIKKFERIDILVNNAGIVIPGTVTTLNLEQWESTWNNNVTSTYLVSHEVIPHMLLKGSGSIVNIASEAGLKGLKERAAYCAAKAAVIGLTKAMAVDYSNSGIKVNCLCPGTIQTESVNKMILKSADPMLTKKNMIERRLTPFLGTVDEVARATLFLANPINSYLTGTILTLDGGSSIK